MNTKEIERIKQVKDVAAAVIEEADQKDAEMIVKGYAVFFRSLADTMDANAEKIAAVIIKHKTLLLNYINFVMNIVEGILILVPGFEALQKDIENLSEEMDDEHMGKAQVHTHIIDKHFRTKFGPTISKFMPEDDEEDEEDE